MNTIRVDICYRPLRIGWAIRAGDTDAFRRAVRLSYTLWGGRFNPILVVDREEEAKRLVDLFRVDLIWPVGETDEVKSFSAKFPYLIKPFLHNSLFVEGMDQKHAQILDVHNAIAHIIDKPVWKAIRERGVRLHNWEGNDPLTDVLLVQLGAYPDAEETGIDYRAMLMQAADATEHSLASTIPIPARVFDYAGIPQLSSHSLEQHYSVSAGWEFPGFFVGEAGNLDDLVSHWNLRAADIPLWFVDPNYSDRYSEIIPGWGEIVRRLVAHRREREQRVGIWSRRRDIGQAQQLFSSMELMICHVSEVSWNGLNVRVPMMHLGQASVLGIMGNERNKPKISFSFSEKPFCGDITFHQQLLVASISFVGSLFGDKQHTLEPPYIPELNEFYARSMHFDYSKLRIESGRVGLVIDAADHDGFLYALPVDELIERIFEMVGCTIKLSSGGLIARQIIAQMGGLQGARPFKIPGVRRLLRTYGPTAAFTKGNALQLIGGRDPDRDPETSGAKFNDYRNLHIEQRPTGTILEPIAVFAYLVEKGIFRIGMELTCPNCRMVSWTPLDSLRQRVVCELCGCEYDATRQMVNGEWHYRRSGVLGAEKNAQGAVPVVLALQQLDANFHGLFNRHNYLTSLNLEPQAGIDLPKCEIDFVWVIPRPYHRKTAIIIGECKDRGPIGLEEFEQDVENLRRVADAFPPERFEPYILLSKLAPFTPEEIERARGLNERYRERAILLTGHELEPYHVYERANAELGIRQYVTGPEDMVQATRKLYFSEEPPN